MSEVLDELRRALGARVREEADQRAAHRRDSWVLSELRDLEGAAGPLPLAVVEAQSREDVSATLRVCRETGTPVVTYGGGSGVCGAILADAESVVLSTRGLEGLVRLDERNLTAHFAAGTLGIDAERRVEREGLTIGHWPQSVELSTVGGWVATRACGQFSTAYGSIEDLLWSLEVVLPDGRVLRTRETPRAAAGPDLRHLFLGSEGTLGVVTEVGFSLRAQPEARFVQAFHFDASESEGTSGIASGLEPVRKLIRAGWRPPVVRLYDARESGRHFREHCPRDRAMLLFVHEGPASAVAAEREAVAALCAEAGAEPSSPQVVESWLETRNHVPSFRSFLEQGVVVDTIEVAAPWDAIGLLYSGVTAALAKVPGLLAATAHSSHSYRSGTNLYFSFAVKPESPAGMADAYRECWNRTMEATLAAGGGIAHHHGVGRVRRDHLEGELGEVGLDLLRRLKSALDPAGLLNPGNLIAPLAPAPAEGARH